MRTPLYLEVLGELGLVGLAPARGVCRHGARRRRATRPPQRDAGAAALLAAAVGFLLAAGIDWMWQLTAVGAVGVLCLGLLTGSGGCSAVTGLPRRPAIARVVIAALGVAAIAAQAPPLLSQLHLDDSQAAAAAGRLNVAAADARRAHVLQPWAASPLLQLALVEEQVGRPRAGRARPYAERSRVTDPTGGSGSSRHASRPRPGASRSARRSLAEARRLNPRSPIFQGALR